MSKPYVVLSLVILGVIAFLLGCGDDEVPTLPPIEMVWIECTPDEINAPWNLAHEGGSVSVGSGDSTLHHMETGQYTISWGDVPGWVTPNSETHNLTTGWHLTFSGVYEQQINPAETGTIVIDPEPEIIDAPWELSGPEGYARSWSGDLTLEDMAPGSYTLTWGWVSDRISPPPETLILAADEEAIFYGIYSEGIAPSGDYVLIPPPSITIPTIFTMGSDYREDETPHQVTLTNRFLMADTEVTIGQYLEVLHWAINHGYASVEIRYGLHVDVLDNLDDSTEVLLDLSGDIDYEITYSSGWFYTQHPDRPVGRVTWFGAAAYCDWLSLRQGLPRAYNHSDWSCNGGNPYTAPGYRLPTEAEWEMACRAGTTTHYNTGNTISTSQANFAGSIGHRIDVASYQSSTWGLYDMHGNVYEWCNDWYGLFSGNDLVDPPDREIDHGDAPRRVIRGGCYSDAADNCRSARRYEHEAERTGPYQGMRPVRTVRN